MSKPRKTVADYVVIALSPVLIMALVGSLCFFLIEVFYRGQMIGGVCWVMFWFIVGIVLVSRIAIEKSTEHAVVYGLGLAAATSLYMHRTQPSSLLGMILLAIVWFCAHKLVWDCTLIDDEQDSSGCGLLQKADDPQKVKEGFGPRSEFGTELVTPKIKMAGKASAPHSPGRWVVYFSLAALPLFGVGQMLLPRDAAAARRAGFGLLAIYLAAALGLLVTTSFLGLRRYLRQRYLTMPPAIAVAWLKFGAGVACIVLIGAVILPRPGANAAWATLRYQIDYQLRRASDYATRANPPGQGQGRAGNQTGGKQGGAQQSDQTQGNKQTPNQEKPGETQKLPQRKSAPAVSSAQAGNIHTFLRTALLIAAALVIGAWIVRRRHLLLEMARSILAALAQFIRNLFDLMPSHKPSKTAEAAPVHARLLSFAEYRNPFFTVKDRAWPPEQIILYSYEAVQAWAKELGIAARPEETAREFCGRLSEQRPELDLDTLARLYAHAAYGRKLPPQCDLEPIRKLWRRLAAQENAEA
ncbi:MAG: DUF4129 domain-containing protein [Limisphaerales bacterium]